MEPQAPSPGGRAGPEQEDPATLGLQLSSTGAPASSVSLSLAWITRWGLCAKTFSLKEF